MKKILILLLLIAVFAISKDLNSSKQAKKENIFLRLDTGGHTALIRDIIVTKDKDIITCSDDKTIRVWDSKTGKEKRKILGEIGVGNEGKIYAIALSPDEKYLAVGGFILGSGDDGSRAGSIRIYSYKTGKLLKVLKSHINVVNDLSFSSDGKFLISGSADKNIKIWNIERLELYKTIRVHSDKVTAVRLFQKENQYFSLSVGNDNQLILFDINESLILKRKSFKKLFYSQIAMSDKYIAINGVYKIYIYNYNLDIIDIIQTQTALSTLAYSPDSKLLVAGHRSKPNRDNIYILDKNKYKKLTSFIEYKNTTTAVAFLNNREVIIAGGNNFRISIFDIYNQIVKSEIEGVGVTIFQVGMEKNKIMWTDKKSYFVEQNKLKVIIPNKIILKKNMDLTSFRIEEIEKKIFNNAFPKRKNSLNLTHVLETNKCNWILFMDRLFLEKNNTIKLEIAKNNPNRNHISYGFYNNYIISGGSHGHLQLYTLEGQEIANFIGHIGDVTSLNVYKDRLVSGSSDQTIRIWDLSFLGREALASKTTKIVYPLLNIFVSKDNEWIVWTSEGYFNASPNGVKYLYFHRNQGVEKEAKAIPIERLYDHFFRPDLIKLKLAGEEEAYKKAIGKLDFREALKNPPPDVKIIKVDNKKVTKNRIIETNKNSIDLVYKVIENFNEDGKSGGVGLIRIYQEGKLIYTIGKGVIRRQSANIDAIIEQSKLDAIQKEKQREYIASIKQVRAKNASLLTREVPKTKTITITNKSGEYPPIKIDLKSGKNEITIEAFNKTNTVASFRESIIVNAKIPKRKPKLYVIVAGANKFQSDAEGVTDLKYSKNDANAIKRVAEERMKTVFDSVEVIPLIDENLTKVNLYREIRKISKEAHLEDTIIFYISTHGRSIGEKLFLIPNNNGDVGNWIDFEQLFKDIQSIEALNQIFIIDACESGKANDIVSAVYDSKVSVLAKSFGVHLLLATTRGTNAFESQNPNIKHGVFTYRILQALRSKVTDLNKDKFISIKEVSEMIRKPQDNIDYQYPIIRNVGNDIKLEKVE